MTIIFDSSTKEEQLRRENWDWEAAHWYGQTIAMDELMKYMANNPKTAIAIANAITSSDRYVERIEVDDKGTLYLALWLAGEPLDAYITKNGKLTLKPYEY